MKSCVKYLLALDLVNHLFLHVEPGMKERWDRQLLRRFQLQLHEDQTVEFKVQKLREELCAKSIELQQEIRAELASVRKLEHDLYILMIEKEQASGEKLTQFNKEILDLEKFLNDKKDILNKHSEEMAVTLQESQQLIKKI